MEPEEPEEPKENKGAQEMVTTHTDTFFHVNMFFIPFVLGELTGKHSKWESWRILLHDSAFDATHEIANT